MLLPGGVILQQERVPARIPQHGETPSLHPSAPASPFSPGSQLPGLLKGQKETKLPESTNRPGSTCLPEAGSAAAPEGCHREGHSSPRTPPHLPPPAASPAPLCCPFGAVSPPPPSLIRHLLTLSNALGWGPVQRGEGSRSPRVSHSLPDFPGCWQIPCLGQLVAPRAEQGGGTSNPVLPALSTSCASLL
ncbi:WAS/WASL-interacting protein family member 3-like [Calypte anna]|uniref:WAS/WASL-interacting protein family member 3-like n=1 Tax=Calypte anna TaxID=9244 RepID=UPI0011C46CFA|nr:WAS/WASL-interacting protein family member 3-like [Calypte anna]